MCCTCLCTYAWIIDTYTAHVYDHIHTLSSSSSSSFFSQQPQLVEMTGILPHSLNLLPPSDPHIHTVPSSSSSSMISIPSFTIQPSIITTTSKETTLYLSQMKNMLMEVKK